jgi:DNA-binding transcriptional LysR family regulator
VAGRQRHHHRLVEQVVRPQVVGLAGSRPHERDVDPPVIRIGFTGSASFHPFVTGAIRDYRALYPEVQVELDHRLVEQVVRPQVVGLAGSRPHERDVDPPVLEGEVPSLRHRGDPRLPRPLSGGAGGTGRGGDRAPAPRLEGDRHAGGERVAGRQRHHHRLVEQVVRPQVVGLAVVTGAIRDYRALYPEVQVELVEEVTARLLLAFQDSPR